MVTISDPRRLGLAIMLATDDASSVLPRFNHCGGRKIRAYALLIQKPVLQPVFDLKHPRNHDKSIHDLKKPSKNQTQSETKNQLGLRFVFS